MDSIKPVDNQLGEVVGVVEEEEEKKKVEEE